MAEAAQAPFMMRAGALWRKLRQQTFWVLLLVLIAVLVALQVGALVKLALQDGAAGLRALLADPGTPRVLWNTALLAFGSLVVAMVAGGAVAFSVWALPPRARRYTTFLPVMPLLIPGVAHVIGFVFLFSPENGYINSFLRLTPFFSDSFSGPFNVYTIWGIIIYTGLSLASYVYLFVFTGLQDLGTDYIQAARANGAGPARTLFMITIPMLRPVFVFAGMIVLLLALGQFTGPLMLGRRQGIDVITTQMYLVTTEFPVDYALGASYAIPLLLVAALILWSQQKIIGNRDRFVGRGHTSIAMLPTPLSLRILAVGTIVVFALISAILPLLALIFVALSPFWSGTVSLAHLTTSNIQHVLRDPVVVASIFTTIKLALISIVIVLPLGMLAAMAIFYRSLLWRPLSVAMDAVASLPLAIPSALIGFGFLFAYSATPFGLYGSAAGLVLAFVTVKLPFAVRYQLSSLIALGSTQVEAARANGSGSVRTFFQIILPLARSGVAAAGAVIFVLLIHEFGVAVMLRSTDTNVMSVVLFELFNTGGLYPQVAAMALVMTVITMVGVIVALAVGGMKTFAKM
jgi:iron(III) transport system permease protein